LYNSNNQQTGWGGQTNTFDLNGNLTSDGANTYTWDARDRLIAMTGPSVAASFAYDAAGRRIRRTINTQTTDLLYDGLTPVQELSASTVLATLLTGPGIDEYFTRTDGTGRRSLLADALGSILALTDDAGTVQTSYTYEPFGATTVSGQGNSNSFQYAGRENDGNGLYYYRARYYYAGLQRFAAEDPLPLHFRSVRELNAYPYVANNPMLFTDPLGLQTMPGTNYCGLGGGGPVRNATDRCCKEHDDCYGRAGVDWTHNVYKTPTPGQIRCLEHCDDVVCWCLSRVTPATDAERRARSWAQAYLCSRFSSGAP
jgi:RHS repeat-associated protein